MLSNPHVNDDPGNYWSQVSVKGTVNSQMQAVCRHCKSTWVRGYRRFAHSCTQVPTCITCLHGALISMLHRVPKVIFLFNPHLTYCGAPTLLIPEQSLDPHSPHPNYLPPVDALTNHSTEMSGPSNVMVPNKLSLLARVFIHVIPTELTLYSMDPDESELYWGRSPFWTHIWRATHTTHLSEVLLEREERRRETFPCICGKYNLFPLQWPRWNHITKLLHIYCYIYVFTYISILCFIACQWWKCGMLFL